MNFYKVISIATVVLFVYLFVQLFFAPDTFITSLGLQSCESGSILGRRSSVFMIGISILLFSSKNLPHSPARQYICLSTCITMLGLASNGSYELIIGTVNSSMITAIIIESTIGVSYLIIFLKNIKVNTK